MVVNQQMNRYTIRYEDLREIFDGKGIEGWDYSRYRDWNSLDDEEFPISLIFSFALGNAVVYTTVYGMLSLFGVV